MAVCNSVNLSEIQPDRFDAEYFRKDYQDNIKLIKKCGNTLCLGDLFKYINRGTQPLYDETGTIKALRSVNVGFMNFNETRQEFVTDEFFIKSNRGKVEKDDILITSTGVGTLGRTSIWFKNERAFCDGHITILRNGIVDPYCIVAFLNSKFGLAQFDQNYRGSSGQIEIYPFDISKFIIPECILERQELFGTLLRKAFDLKEQSKIHYKQANEILKRELNLDKIVFKKAKSYTANFSELISNQRIDSDFYNPDYEMLKNHLKTKCFEKLKNVALLKSGFAFSSKKYKSIGKQIVRIQNISGDFLNLGRNPVFYSDLSLIGLSNFKILNGDTLMAMTGNTIGNCSLNTTNEELYLNQRVLAVTPNTNYVSAEYLNLVLRNFVFKSFIDRELVGGAQPNISLDFIGNQIIPLIDKNKMDLITDLLIEHYKCLDESKILLKQAKTRVEQLIEKVANKN